MRGNADAVSRPFSLLMLSITEIKTKNYSDLNRKKKITEFPKGEARNSTL
jgi:hypothetical protein